MEIDDSKRIYKVSDFPPHIVELCDKLDACIRAHNKNQTERMRISVIATATALTTALVRAKLPVPHKVYKLSVMGLMRHHRMMGV